MPSLRSKSLLKEGISKVATSAKLFASKVVCSVKMGPSEGDLARDGSDGRSGEEWDRREKEEMEESSTAGAMIAVPLIAWPAPWRFLVASSDECRETLSPSRAPVSTREAARVNSTFLPARGQWATAVWIAGSQDRSECQTQCRTRGEGAAGW